MNDLKKPHVCILQGKALPCLVRPFFALIPSLSLTAQEMLCSTNVVLIN